MEIKSAKLICRPSHPDFISLVTNLPDPHTEGETLEVTFTAPRYKGHEYMLKNFPDVFLSILNVDATKTKFKKEVKASEPLTKALNILLHQAVNKRNKD